MNIRLVNQVLPKFIYLVIFFKIIFLLCLVFHVFFITLGKNSKYVQYDDELVKLVHQSDFVFKVLMAILIIFIFYPWSNNIEYINNRIKVLFYVFGFILLLTADWNTFFKESSVYEKVLKAWK